MSAQIPNYNRSNNRNHYNNDSRPCDRPNNNYGPRPGNNYHQKPFHENKYNNQAPNQGYNDKPKFKKEFVPSVQSVIKDFIKVVKNLSDEDVKGTKCNKEYENLTGLKLSVNEVTSRTNATEYFIAKLLIATKVDFNDAGETYIEAHAQKGTPQEKIDEDKKAFREENPIEMFIKKAANGDFDKLCAGTKIKPIKPEVPAEESG